MLAVLLVLWRSLDLPQYCPEDFDEYATVETPTETPDGAGGYTITWAERVGIWCKVETVSGGEGIIAGRLEHSEGLTLTTHYNADILDTDRIELDGEYYKITRIEDVDRKQWYMIIYIETGRT